MIDVSEITSCVSRSLQIENTDTLDMEIMNLQNDIILKFHCWGNKFWNLADKTLLSIVEKVRLKASLTNRYLI